MSVSLTEGLFSKAAGWEAMKRARGYLEQDQVLSSSWAPPLLQGVVQAGGMSFRAGLIIKGPIDIENVCTCRDSREWGKICAHSVAVGLHWLKSQLPAPPARPEAAKPSGPAARPVAPGGRASTGPQSGTRRLHRDPAGTPAELFVILPPNFDQAIRRGKVMLVLEAKWPGGRAPLNALPADTSFAFGAEDLPVLDQLEALAGGETPALLQIEIAEFASLLPALAGHPRVTLGKTAPLRITATPMRLALQATLEPSGEILLALGAQEEAPFPLGNGWVWHRQTLQPLGLPTDLRELFQGPIRLPRLRVPLFLSRHWPELNTACEVEANFALDEFTLEPQAPQFLLELKGGLAQLSALLQCRYGSRILTLGVTAPEDSVWLPDPAAPKRYSTRDFAAEQAAVARLQRCGFGGPDSLGRLQLNGQNAVLNFFAREFPRLQREWTCTLEERLQQSTSRQLERIEPRLEVTPSGVSWFDLGVVFETAGGEKFSAAEIQRLVLSGQSHARLKNGKTALLDTAAVEEFQEVLRDCSPQQHGDAYRISDTQAGFLDATLRQQAGWKVQAPSAWRERAAQQSGDARLVCPPLGNLETVLRPYQKQGVAWLRFLRENGFGGILADEMGLGKTLQTLAFLRAARTAPGLDAPLPPTLVVCPTSLVFNWVAEAAKFTPELRVLALRGPDRQPLFARIPQHDIVVTSYALIRRDAEQFRDLEFDTVVLDEAQHIKNRQTQNAQAVKALRCRHRLVLTGTPLENSVLDLWSIYDFLMPGYLGSASDFRERYEQPITRDRDAAAQTRLSRRLRPFILRRLKRDVAADLPARLEQVAFCELTPDQRGVYQQVIEASRKEVLEAVGAAGLARSRMVVLNALLRLRQVCCDLRLLKLEKINPAEASGKLDLFGELLEEIIDGGHRVLVFSQFVSMLALLKEKLTAESVPFCYLDGSTRDRGAVVEQFQKTSAIPVFLISLKAGGVGLNLTGADTVIHFDPWWNPAVEDQATDRAHRIGQTRVVTSYKLISRDTIEEKILKLQERKRGIIKATLGGEEELTESLTWEEIQELLG